jgi:hypothetical protein
MFPNPRWKNGAITVRDLFIIRPVPKCIILNPIYYIGLKLGERMEEFETMGGLWKSPQSAPKDGTHFIGYIGDKLEILKWVEASANRPARWKSIGTNYAIGTAVLHCWTELAKKPKLYRRA